MIFLPLPAQGPRATRRLFPTWSLVLALIIVISGIAILEPCTLWHWVPWWGRWEDGRIQNPLGSAPISSGTAGGVQESGALFRRRIFKTSAEAGYLFLVDGTCFTDCVVGCGMEALPFFPEGVKEREREIQRRWGQIIMSTQ
ncbi:hypothetical protein M430DRAFT_149933 [Amorphotheca resinae ATCC 22711]|uniref:Uncharacterized protein n=1 Tax=Amorphotheca resinae ATCC 22711 TaxID=857342 RepID=A0A2T3BCM2_AMORE|nr:hypothetical protein M430DRAFT_149933 [Amorphotheca resinae ATCC 22711]PSS27112.1 hypothetical protein M430DRAFT_149933 [Amorphotheca resinae ATCC 22711]